MNSDNKRAAQQGAGPRKDNREKVTAALDASERAALDYILDCATSARQQPSVDAKPTITADMSEDQRAELVDSVFEFELRAELMREFGTLELPTDKANVVRFAIRLLARTLRGATTRAGARAANADPLQADEDAEWVKIAARSGEHTIEPDNLRAPEIAFLHPDTTIMVGSPLNNDEHSRTESAASLDEFSEKLADLVAHKVIDLQKSGR